MVTSAPCLSYCAVRSIEPMERVRVEQLKLLFSNLINDGPVIIYSRHGEKDCTFRVAIKKRFRLVPKHVEIGICDSGERQFLIRNAIADEIRENLFDIPQKHPLDKDGGQQFLLVQILYDGFEEFS